MYSIQLDSNSRVSFVFIQLNSRPGPIMLFKLPIMLLSNAPKFSLLCPNYALLWPIMLHKGLGLMTTLLEYMTVLLEYLDLSISVAGHSKDL